MRILLLTSLAMIAFAANSILNRVGVASGAISAEGFAIVRLGAGVLCLAALVQIQGATWRQPIGRWALGGLSLTIYMLGFSLAYRSLDAGIGALILFGTVQFTMFGWSILRGAAVSRLQIIGSGVALAGLGLVLWPGESIALPVSGVLLMGLAGLGWGAYSLVGKGAGSPLGATAGNFCLSWVLTGIALFVFSPQAVSLQTAQSSGILLAILSGAVTSGMGYAVWYAVLPALSGPFAATVQLSVPVLALLAGVVGLGEVVSLRALLGAALVLGGIAVVLRGGKTQAK